MAEDRKQCLINNQKMSVEQIPLGPFGTNAYLVTCNQTGECLLIDAPGEAEVLQKLLEGKKLKQLLLTHNHLDHLGALQEIKNAFQLPVAVHPEDQGALPVPPDQHLAPGQNIAVGNLELKVFHTPGHTPGSVCFYQENTLIAGDTIFPGGPGKTSSPEDFRTLFNSIKEVILPLPEETLILPGHGEHTYLKKEKEKINRFEEKGFSSQLYGDVTWE